MNHCTEHGDTDVFYPERFDQCPLCKAEVDRQESGKKYRAERTKARHLAHALRAVPGPNRMSFPGIEWADSEKYRKWYEGTRAEALADVEDSPKVLVGCLLIHTSEAFNSPRRCRTGDATLCEFCASLSKDKAALGMEVCHG